jgi:hypothetical protein
MVPFEFQLNWRRLSAAPAIVCRVVPAQLPWPDGYDGVCDVAGLPAGSCPTSKHCSFGGWSTPKQQPGGDDSCQESPVLWLLPDKNRLCVANKDSNSISGFNTLDRSSRIVTGSFIAALGDCALRQPARSAQLQRCRGTIDTTTAGPDSVIVPASVTSNTALLRPEPRLYMPEAQLAILDVAVTPVVLTGADPIQTVAPVRAAPRAVFDHPALNVDSCCSAALRTKPCLCRVLPQRLDRQLPAGDGDRRREPFKSSIAVQGFPARRILLTTRFRVTMAAGGDHCAPTWPVAVGMVNIIDTTRRHLYPNLPAPIGGAGASRTAADPVFLFAGP